METRFSRTERLFGSEGMEKLRNAHVCVFGVGGVGGYVVEALVRSGVGKITVVDNDTVSVSNCNRQIIATSLTVGRDKVEVVKERAESISPDVQVTAKKCFFLPENEAEFDFTEYDYVVDAVDTVSAKIAIAVKAEREGVKLISCMGTGNKLDPMGFIVSDIYKTEMDPLARVMRREIKKRGVKKLKVVYSKEEPTETCVVSEDGVRRSVPASNAFVPACAGLFIASEVIKDLIK